MTNLAEALNLDGVKKIYRNLSVDELVKKTIESNVGAVASNGALLIDTGVFTGRSPKDKFFVKQEPSSNNIAWGDVNKPISKENFEHLFALAKTQLSNKEIYVTDLFTGASPSSRRAVRFITEIPWQSHFVQNMFIKPTPAELENFTPEFTVYNASGVTDKGWKEHGLHSEVFVAFNIEQKMAVIGGTSYTGEMKKGIFSMMNYWLPLENKLPMHCSANIGKNGDVALFFGLSGTGKTTLSTDPHRNLIGDDEHGWDDDGVFNFEGGCYAKVINLSAENEPEIFGAIKNGAILENVIADEKGVVDYTKATKTENTRVSYPIEHIALHQKSLQGGHPKNIIFLSADAFGVLPPVSKLTKEQAMYYFLSGYTAKVAGTERGITEPVATFSSCFGEAFLPLHPTVYAKLLGEKIDKYGVNVYLVNTGWSGGAYGVGKRMSIKNTRACINGILSGAIEKSEFDTLSIFNLTIPKTLTGVDTEVLNPRNTWTDKAEYDANATKLAKMFQENFKKYVTTNNNFDYTVAGPKL